MGDSRIIRIWAREVLDSRGNPTVEAEVHTPSLVATGIAPSGASTGKYEVLELRDGGKRFGGKGVMNAVENVRRIIGPRLEGMDVTCQKEIDKTMIELDGTMNKARLGGNAITAVSMACARAGSMAADLSLHEYLGTGSNLLPVPMMNIINGGKHAGSNLRIQEFMIVPAGAKSFSEAYRIGSEIYHALKEILRASYGSNSTNVGDEGGFAPPIGDTREALDVIEEAIRVSGHSPGKDVFMALDSAASEFFSHDFYEIDGKKLKADEMIDFYEGLARDYPILSLEDPLEENSFEETALLTKRLGAKVQIVGDDLFVTNVERIKKGVEIGAANALLLKVNQIGTITESFEAAAFSLRSGYGVIVSHRSGETEDTSISDIAVALGCGQIKSGAPTRAERTAKYNRLLRIEETLGTRARFSGMNSYGKYN
ncbi:MAG: phosphopyruvate hydratase [Methanomassiliicoccales archaeon]|nr:phosphopyruvate hydratase [Methanomassiliicoccales archaeon]